MKILVVILLSAILLILFGTLCFAVVDLWVDEWDHLKDRRKKRHKEVDDG